MKTKSHKTTKGRSATNKSAKTTYLKKDPKEGSRKTNPGLHALYVGWAVKHLAVIEECTLKISNLANLNMNDILIAIYKEKEKLIKINPAYMDAMEILNSIRDIKFYRPDENQ
jgi:hypothetical protein